MKRLFALFLSIVLILGCSPLAYATADDFLLEEALIEEEEFIDEELITDYDGLLPEEDFSEEEETGITHKYLGTAGEFEAEGIYWNNYPEVKSLTNSAKGETLHAGDTVTFTVDFVYNDVLNDVYMHIGKNTNNTKYINLQQDPDTGLWVGSYTFSEYDLNGSYFITDLYATDVYGFHTSYSSSSKRVMQRLFPGYVYLEGCADPEKMDPSSPSGTYSPIKNIKLDCINKNLRPGDKLNFSFDIPAGTDVHSIYVSFRTLDYDHYFSTSYYSWDEESDFTFDQATGHVTGSYTITEDNVIGTYKLSYIDVYPSNGSYLEYNTNYYDDSTLFSIVDAAPVPAFTITDITSPEHGKTLTDGQSVHVSLRANAPAEIRFVNLELRMFLAEEPYDTTGISHSTYSIDLQAELNPATGLFEAEFPLEEDTVYGTYVINRVRVRDSDYNYGYASTNILFRFAESAGENLKTLPIATDLQWHEDGTCSFTLPADHQGMWYVQWINAASGDSVTSTTYYGNYSAGGTTITLDEFRSSWSTIGTGTYRFTVQLRGDGVNYFDGPVAVSDDFEYVMPTKALGTIDASTMVWPNENEPRSTFKIPNDPNVGGYQIRYYYAETADQAPTECNWSTRNTFGEWTQDRTTGQCYLFDDLFQTFGTGYYYYKVRLMSGNIFAYRNGDWSELSPAYSVANVAASTEQKLDDIDPHGKTPEEIRNEVQSIPTEELKQAMLSSEEIVDQLKQLEDATGIKTEVEVNPEIPLFTDTNVSIVGAALNETEDTGNITLNIDKPKYNDIIPAMYDNTLAVKFSMELENVKDTDNLKVPVLIDIPVPENIEPAFLVILHYHVDGGAPEIIRPFIYSAGGKYYAQFALERFSDFVLTQELEPSDDTVARNNSYMLMKVGETKPVQLLEMVYSVTDEITYKALDANGVEYKKPENAVISVDDYGNVTALKAGTAYVAAIQTWGEGRYFEEFRCRIDVLADKGESTIANAVSSVVLTASKATVELYDTYHTRLTIIPQGDQIIRASGLLPEEAIPNVGNHGAAVTSAEFTDAAAAALFRLAVIDDRTLEIVPTYEAMSNPSAVKSSYKSAISVTIDGKDFTLKTSAGKDAVLAMSVKKSMPKLKVAALKFNTALSNNRIYPSVTGGYVTYAEPDYEAAAKKKTTPMPDWMTIGVDEYGSGYVELTKKAPQKASGTLYLQATVEGCAVTVPVTVKYTLAYSAPKVTLSAKSVTLNPSTPGPAELVFSAKDYYDGIPVTVKSITEKVGKNTVTYKNGQKLDVKTTERVGSTYVSIFPTYSDSATHKYTVTLEAFSKEYKVAVTVLPTGAGFSMTAKASGSIDLAIPNSPAYVTPTFKNVSNPLTLATRFQIIETNKASKGTMDVTNQFNMLFDGVKWAVSAKKDAKLMPGSTYALTITEFTYKRDEQGEPIFDENGSFIVIASASATVKLSIKTSNPSKVQPSIKLKVSGKVDPVRYNNGLTITATYKNYFNNAFYYPMTGVHAEYEFTFTENGKKLDGVFDVDDVSKAGSPLSSFEIKPIDPTVLDSAKTYMATLTIHHPDGSCTSSAVKLPVAMKAVKMASSSKEVSLLAKDGNDSAEFYLYSMEWVSNIEKVTLDDTSAKLFKLTDLGSGKYQISYLNHTVPAGIKAGASKTVKLNVFLKGNHTPKANATVSLKVKLG